MLHLLSRKLLVLEQSVACVDSHYKTNKTTDNLSKARDHFSTMDSSWSRCSAVMGNQLFTSGNND